MNAICSKCIESFREQKRRLELIHDLKAKNEGMSHASLKNEACSMIRGLGKENFPDDPTIVETEVSVEGIGKVDVFGRIGEGTIAVECGKTNLQKILALEERFDVVLHIPYCYTWNLININIGEITRQLFIGQITKELEKRGQLRVCKETRKFVLKKVNVHFHQVEMVFLKKRCK